MGISADQMGVSGRSNSAPGVIGDSVSSYGGLFSGGLAPLRLTPAGTRGAPTAGFHQAGELFVDDNINLFFCKASGTPGMWVRIA
jgi:hypothetical protein